MKTYFKSSISLLSATLVVSLSACQSSPSINKTYTPSKNTVNDSMTSPDITGSATSLAPWAKSAINNSNTDAVYRQEWLKAESKRLCPILAMPKQASSHLTGHNVRRANFASGWGVAYDLPNMRSAYGVANAGTIDPDELSFSWPYNMSYQDGSMVGYGHEGGDPSAKWLAYIVIPQNNCFYNVWSAQGKNHLEQMIKDLRMVKN